MKIGDSVKFLNHSGKGIIKNLELPKVFIENEFGFLEEWDKNEIIVWEEDLKVVEIPTIFINEDDAINEKPKNLKETEIIIDLHIGHLVDYPNKYSAHEKLQLQIKTAKESIEKYRKITEKLILIHGKGKGTLETELYKILQSASKISFYDADFKRYKLGAVEIRYLD